MPLGYNTAQAMVVNLASVTLLALAGVLCGEHNVAAEPTQGTSEAKRLMIAGAERLDKRDYKAALENFTAAMKLVPNAKIEFGIGLALEGLGENALAYEAFTRYLAGPKDDKAERWQGAIKRQTELRLRVVFLNVKADKQPATLSVNDKGTISLPLHNSVVLEPGIHKVRVDADGTSWTETINGQPGSTYVLKAHITSRQVAMPKAERSPLLGEPTLAARQSAKAVPSNANGHVWIWSAAAVVVVGIVATAVVLSSSTKTERVCAMGIECISAK